MMRCCVFVLFLQLVGTFSSKPCSESGAIHPHIDSHTKHCFVKSNKAMCKSRCGQVTFNDISSRPDHTCSCDKLCLHYHDCCPDYYEHCTNGTAFTAEYPSTSCIEASTGKVNEKRNTIVVSDCPSYYHHEEIASKCRYTNGSIFTRVPVRDKVTNIQYRNRFCAICNNVTNYTFWRFNLGCEANATDKVKSTFGEFLTHLNDPKCNFTFYDPAEKYRFCVLGSIMTCKRDCKNHALIDKCHRSQTLFTYRGSNNKGFKNAFCAICNGYPDIQTKDLTCRSNKFPKDGPGLTGSDNSLWKFSFSLLLDINSAGGIKVGLKSSLTSNSGSSVAACALDNLQNCVFKSCQKGYELKNGTCVPSYILSDVDVEISYIPIASDFVFKEIYFTGNVEPTLYKEGLNELFQINMSPEITAYRFNESLGSNFYVLGIRIVAKFSQKLPANCDVDEVEKTMNSAKELLKSRLKAIFIRKSMGWVKSVDIFATVRQSCQNSTNSSCYVIERYNGTFEIRKGGSVWLSDRNQTLEPGEYRLLNNTVLICGEEDKNNATAPEMMVSGILGIVTIVCLVISEVCLLARLVLQFFVPLYHTFPAKLQFCLIASLFVSGLVYLLRPAVAKIHGLCFAFGVLAQLAYLSVFVWMNLIAIDTWNTFSPKKLLKSKPTGKRFLVFFLCAWLVPAVVVAFSVVLEFLDIDEDFKPQYTRNGVCWITGKYALLVMFAAPLAVIVLSNIVFLILTAVTLHRAMRFSHTVSSSKTTEKDEFYMYLKLFVLLGVTWVFGFLAILVEHEAFWYIFAVLNASQGAFLFITTVLTKRVRAYMKSRDFAGNTIETSTRSGRHHPKIFSSLAKLAPSVLNRNGYDLTINSSCDDTAIYREETRM